MIFCGKGVKKHMFTLYLLSSNMILEASSLWNVFCRLLTEVLSYDRFSLGNHCLIAVYFMDEDLASGGNRGCRGLYPDFQL